MQRSNDIIHHMADNCVVIFKWLASSRPDDHDVTLDHRDDYFIIGMVEKGNGRGFIDFKPINLTAGEMFVVQPGQVHRFVNTSNAEGWALIVDSRCVGMADKDALDRFALYASTLPIDGHRQTELRQLAAVIAGRCGEQSPAVIALASAMVSIITEAMRCTDLYDPKHSKRRMDIIVSFKHLLNEHLHANRQPAYYASLLNITTGYLNEVVKESTGMSASACIKAETVLRAKRMLADTDLSVKEIAIRLGFDDYAYFSRLFSRTAGMPATLFRQKYRE